MGEGLAHQSGRMEGREVSEVMALIVWGIVLVVLWAIFREPTL